MSTLDTRPGESPALNNRERVLRAAREAFLTDGYSRTSLASVARSAGFTTGIVYSAFGSKLQLAMEVLTDLQHEELELLSTALRGAQTVDEMLRGLREWIARTTTSGWTRFDLEVLMDSLGDPQMIPLHRQRQDEAVRQIFELMRSLVATELIDDTTLEVLATAVIDYGIGIGVRHAVNPDATPEPMISLIEPLLAQLRG